MKNIILLLTILCSSLCMISQKHEEHNHDHSKDIETPKSLDFIQNKGQWNKNVQFLLPIPEGQIFFHKNYITYDFHNQEDLRKIDEMHHKSFEQEDLPANTVINKFAYKVNFKNSNNINYKGLEKQIYYQNYILGNDSKKWAPNVPLFHQMIGKNLYANIDIKTYSKKRNFKYDFIVHPNANYKDIKLEYEGVKSIKTENGNLILDIGFNKIIEQKPLVYQIINGRTILVKANYILDKNTVSFQIEKYNTNYDLIIDPIVLASTYSGTTSSIYGHTATYDDNGNIYVGGAGFSPGGLPTTTGVYQTLYGGSRDMCINKYNQSGSTLIYSTYLGGSDSDFPHSLIDFQGKLYVLGSSSSTNYPTTLTGYDRTHNGFSDIVVTILNSTGSALIGSTYIGGSGDDGINSIYTNYGDRYKGEITTDNLGNCYVSSFSESSNFPTSTSAFQSTLGGMQDGVALKLNSTASTLNFSTYLGGTLDDAAYGVKLHNSKVYITGSAGNGFFTHTGAAFPTHSGNQDAFVIALNNTGTTKVHATYFGTTSKDQSFFIDDDSYGDMYILGQTAGTVTATTGKYAAGGTGIFITKFNDSLNTHIFNSTTGDVAPVAFLVDECDNIYVSGHGGLSSLTGFTITTNASQSSSAGFYIMVLHPDADSIFYGSYYGNSGSHVDGGTSRFDKKGVVYQATCSSSLFPTVTGSYATAINTSAFWDMTVFKIDLEAGIARARALPHQDSGCAPFLVNFTNTSKGNKWYWDFDDGSPIDSTKSPSHTFINIGTYNVTLISIDTGSTCNFPDTLIIKINVLTDSAIILTPDTSICPGTSANLLAQGATNYSWTPTTGLSNPNIANPIATPTSTTTYRVIATSKCLIDTGFVTVTLYPINTSLSNDTLICAGNSIGLLATGATSYSWSPSTGLSSSTIPNPIATPLINTKYLVQYTTSDNCIASDSLTISLQQGIPSLTTSNDTIVCVNAPVNLWATGATSYLWHSNRFIPNPTSASTTVTPSVTSTYYVDGTNICGTEYDTVNITIQKPTAISSPDESICFDETTKLWASGGLSYLWEPSIYLNSNTLDTVLYTAGLTTQYQVIVTDNLNCKDTAYSKITIFPTPVVDAGDRKIIDIGTGITLNPTFTPGIITWDFHPTLTCTSCINPFATPESIETYTVNLIDANGCKVTDTVIIVVKGVIVFAPNTFTPNNDGVNEGFRVLVSGDDLQSYHLYVFTRWGEVIFETTDENQSWNGKYKDDFVKNDAYIWKLEYSDYKGSKEIIGHVNVLR